MDKGYLRIRYKRFCYRDIASVLTIIHRRGVSLRQVRVQYLCAHHWRIAGVSRHDCARHDHVYRLRRLVPGDFTRPARVAAIPGIIVITMSAIMAFRCDRFVRVGFIGGHFSHYGWYHGVD